MGIMRLNVRQIGHVAVVDLSGNITIGGGDAVLRQGVFKLLEDNQKHILLNLQHVLYMDSSGIGEMAACYKAAKKKNGSIKLLSPSEKVRDQLQITKLEDEFEIYRNEKEALSSF
jgi:anti-anti-sigma factor